MPLVPLLLAASAALLAPPSEVQLRDDHVRAGDLADAGELGETIIARLPRNAGEVEFDRDQAANLLSRAFPGRRFNLSFESRIVLKAGIRDKVPSGECFAAADDFSVGEVLDRERLEPVACSDQGVDRGLGYDKRLGAPVARRSIANGAYLGAMRPAGADQLAPGRKLVFRTGEGPVMIEREVVTLQNGRSGERVFARTADGEVIAARVNLTESETQEGEAE